jgi:hypothetical protein
MHTIEQLNSGGLKGAHYLKLQCGLTTFPEQILDLADSLEILDLSGNQLSVLPDSFARLHKLKIVFFSDNLFTVFPAVLYQCRQLDIIGFKANQIRYISEQSIPENTRWLILTNNRLEALPAAIGNCSRLQKCMLAGNRLTTLPESLQNCNRLELLRVSANRLASLPGWLLRMPCLSWLAFAGNPFSTRQAADSLETINWHDLTVTRQLGEGASGIISRADWKRNGSSLPVAVKIFKGEVTSDGFPADEMQASMMSGLHPNLVPVLGKVTGHTKQKQGLVFELIPEGYANLASPPSFETCTRDTFTAGQTYTTEQILRIVRGIASAAAHLHARGILHGDLYCHNTLVNEECHALFGDFGAATLYDTADATLARRIQQLEVRAWGCMADDLLQQSQTNGDDKAVLVSLKDACLHPDIDQRPLFTEILQALEA